MTSSSLPRSHRDLAAWRAAVALAEKVNMVAGALPASERFGLGGRLRGAAGAVPVSIATGHGWGHVGSYLDELSAALASLARLQLELMVMTRHGYLSWDEAGLLTEDCGRVRRLLGCLVASLHGGRGSLAGGWPPWSGRLDGMGARDFLEAGSSEVLTPAIQGRQALV